MPDMHLKEKTFSPDKFGNIVPEGYEYKKKLITPGKNFLLNGAYLKWYELYPPGLKFTEKQVSETRQFLITEAESGRLEFENELGFVILHRAGDYLLLLINTWRSVNEIWESIYFKKADEEGPFKQMIFDDHHKGTFCVWELGIVWHERNAWVRFIKSERDEKAKVDYINEVFHGEI